MLGDINMRVVIHPDFFPSKPQQSEERLLSGGQLGHNLLTLGSGLPESLLWLCMVS